MNGTINDTDGVKEKEKEHRNFYRSLSEEEILLITLRDELYGGSWERMEQDLKDRLEGKPYIFKLANRIEEDLVRLERLRDYEEKHGINLADFAQDG